MKENESLLRSCDAGFARKRGTVHGRSLFLSDSSGRQKGWLQFVDKKRDERRRGFRQKDKVRENKSLTF